MPSLRASSGELKLATFPLRRIRPASGRQTPQKTFIKVDLPEPWCPSRAWIEPVFTSRSTSRSAFDSPNDLERPSAWSRVVDSNWFTSRFLTCSVSALVRSRFSPSYYGILGFLWFFVHYLQSSATERRLYRPPREAPGPPTVCWVLAI